MSAKSKTFLFALLAAGLALGPGNRVAPRAQDTQSQSQSSSGQIDETEETRQIKYSDFTKNRPAAKPADTPKTTSSGGDTASWNAPTYHRVKPAAAPVRRRPARPKTTSTASTKPNNTKPDKNAKPDKPPRTEATETKDVGVTLWRLRPAKETDTGPGFQVLQGGKLVVMTPERIEGTAPVALGDRVRISVESPRDGYLYVINREQYADGTTGAPALIFPTTRIRGGDNKVYAGRLVDIPDAGDAQPFFTLTTNQKPGQPQNVGELITILITPRPLEGVTPERNPVLLSQEQVDKWEDNWEGDVAEVLEMNGGAGRAWTNEEKQAGEATRSLTQIDPTPQTIYRVSSKANDPLMLTVQLLYGTPAGTQAGTASTRP